MWLRAHAHEGEALDDARDLRARLLTVAARRAYDVLGSAETAGTAMLLVMEGLSPPERVAFVLHQAFDVP